MTQSAALSPAFRPRAGADRDAHQTNCLLAHCPEDRHLAQRVERALHATGYGPLRGIAVSVQARLVILEGRVPSYHLKQVAQASVLSVAGVNQVRNDLRVGRRR
jgi:osmotically-inducible protein OsmY